MARQTGPLARWLAAAGALVLVALQARPSFAQSCDPCWDVFFNRADGVWDCKPSASGTACDDGNACTSGDHCDGHGACVGTLSCAPGTPGAPTGPSSSSTGAYTISWGAASGVVADYELWENGQGILSSTALSASLSGRLDGTYGYQVRACNSAGCSSFTTTFNVTVLLPPGVPGAISAPPETGPTYDISWGTASGTIDHYEVGESSDGGSTWPTTTSVATTSLHVTGKPYGTYTYRVRSCNATACSAYVTASVSVVVITGLSALPDSAPVAPSMPVPSQGWVGTVPGTPGAGGGGAAAGWQ